MNALDHIDDIKKQSKEIAIFLDYDGTLTPIVPHPDQALLTDEQRKTLAKLAKRFPVAIISGRDRKNVAKLVGLDSLVYAGSHGFDIEGPGIKHEEGQEYLPSLDQAEKALKIALPDVFVERKKYAIAIHYRQVDPKDVPQIEKKVREVHAKHPDLRLKTGKMIFELQPNIDWDKGKALLHLLHLMQLDKPTILPIYIGDDVTDEDAFKAIKGQGVGIAVQEEPKKTYALYTLKDPDGVYQFFNFILS